MIGITPVDDQLREDSSVSTIQELLDRPPPADFVSCPMCDGSGQAPCGTCKGRGSHPCSICAGTGVDRDQLGTDSETCMHCDGTGFGDCSICEGSGKVWCVNCAGDGMCSPKAADDWRIYH